MWKGIDQIMPAYSVNTFLSSNSKGNAWMMMRFRRYALWKIAQQEIAKFKLIIWDVGWREIIVEQ
jgi:hypothetical protein